MPTATEPGSWLEDLAHAEDAPEDIGPLDLSFDPADEQPPSRAITPPTPSATETVPDRFPRFLADVGSSFLFVAGPGNLVTFVVVAMLPWALEFVPIFGWALALIARLYVCAFLLATITEMASGEDDLPTVRVASPIDDLLMPLLRFLGTLLWVSLPAIACATACYHILGHVQWTAVVVLAAAGLLLWPAVVLAVAIGNGFNGVWPHVIIRTAMSAPHAYAVVCATVLAAFGVTFLPDAPFLANALDSLYSRNPLSVEIIISLLNTYAMIVAMRVIGLFYRHYKHRFPWTAE